MMQMPRVTIAPVAGTSYMVKGGIQITLRPTIHRHAARFIGWCLLNLLHT
jgi:hypothetical protein